MKNPTLPDLTDDPDDTSKKIEPQGANRNPSMGGQQGDRQQGERQQGQGERQQGDRQQGQGERQQQGDRQQGAGSQGRQQGDRDQSRGGDKSSSKPGMTSDTSKKSDGGERR